VKQGVKHFLGRSVFAAQLDALLLRQAGVVVAFHRVHDGAPQSDSLTVDVATFERYCKYFRDHFHVVALPDLVATLQARRPLDRRLAITFDDGYRDNFQYAAPALERFSLPATFFVVTEWLGTEIVPFWDSQLGVRQPWMTWDEVHSLQRRGFDIGAHTRSHVDLGVVSGAVACDEIAGARLQLERHLGPSPRAFAYPYGQRHNITESNRALVRSAGFYCCCSGFGGVNTPTTDPFHLLRVPISHFYQSPHQFGFDVVLGRTTMTWPAAGRA
jgi:peptidoglycan/xylan/chitin deacetylase (PgdA/CDA1 family)